MNELKTYLFILTIITLLSVNLLNAHIQVRNNIKSLRLLEQMIEENRNEIDANEKRIEELNMLL